MERVKETIQLKPYDFKVGIRDNDDIKIEKIYAKSPEYVVYRTESSICVDINDDSEKCDEILSNHLKIGTNLARVYSWLPENLSWSESINIQIARAMVNNIEGNFEDAVVMLNHAEERIIKLKTIQGRLQYTLSAFGIVLMIFLISLFVDSEPASFYIILILCGALGGVLSISIGFNKLSIDIDANWQTNCLIGGSRILIAITASLFAFFAIRADIAFSFAADVDSNYGVYLIAMVAGFAEMLVPNLMNNLVNETKSHK